MFIAVCLVLLALIGAFLYGTSVTKLSLNHRYLQIRHVFITIVYAVISVIGFSLWLMIVNGVLSIPSIRNGLYLIVPRLNTAASFYWIVTLSVNLLFIALFFLILKLVKWLWTNPMTKESRFADFDSEDHSGLDVFFDNISSLFYHFDGDNPELNDIAINVGIWIKAIKRIFLFLLVMESVVLTVCLGFQIAILPEASISWLVKGLYMLPLASYIILNQFEIFLCTEVSVEEGMVTTEDVEGKMIGDYSPLIECYDENFSNQALISYYIKGEGDFSESIYAGVSQEQLKKCDNPKLLEAIHRNILNSEKFISERYIDSVIAMINNQHIAVSDAVFGDFTIYLLAYLQHILLLHNKVIVICEDKFSINETVRKFTDGFKVLNKVSSIWRVKTVENFDDEDADILVCTGDELLTGRLKHKYPRFFDRITNAVIMNAYELVAGNKAFVGRVFNYLNEKNVKYVFYIPENNADIKNALKIFVGADIETSENYAETTNTCIMYWRSEAHYKTQYQLSPNIPNDFGVAYSIAAIAAKYGVYVINLHAPGCVPVLSYENIATGEYAKKLAHDFFDTETINLKRIVSVNDMKAFDEKELAFNIIYDENNNLIALTNLWLSYGGKQCSLVHFISRPYMFRDYFAFNLSEFTGNIFDIKIFVPLKTMEKRASAIAFLIKTRQGVGIQEIQNYAHFNGIEETNAENILANLLNLVFGNDRFKVYDCFSFDESIPDFKNDSYVYTHLVKMSNEELYEQLCALTTENAIVSEDTLHNNTPKIILPVNAKDVYNYYLPNQCCSFNGCRYYIKDIVNGELRVTTEDTVLEEKEYLSLYHIAKVENYQEIQISEQTINPKWNVRYFNADVTKNTYAYLEYSDGISFNDSCMKRNTLLNQIVEKKNVNGITLKLSTAEFGNSDKVIALLVVLLRGAMETLLPKNYKDLLIFSNLNKQEFLQAEHADVSAEQWQNLIDMFPDIQMQALQEDGNSLITIIDYSTMETGALNAIVRDIDRILLILKNYLLWEHAKCYEKSWLKFGLKEFPSIFDIDGTKQWLECVTKDVVLPESIYNGKHKLMPTRYCSFCGRPILTQYTEYSDGRIMCHYCSQHVLNKKREVRKLLATAYSVLENKYKINLPKGIRIEMATQEKVDSIHPPLPGYHVLGVYVSSQKKLYVVKGGPETQVLATLIHELVHAWQHKEVPVILTEENTVYCEGHSMYVEIECMKALKETRYAYRLEKETEERADEYGRGFVMWREFLKKQEDKNIFNHVKKIEKGEMPF